MGGTVMAVTDPARLPAVFERNPAVQADDHEGEQRLVEPAAGVGPGRVSQVEPDRVGDAVAVVVDVVGDLAGGVTGNQVGEGGGVMAVERARAGGCATPRSATARSRLGPSMVDASNH